MTDTTPIPTASTDAPHLVQTETAEQRRERLAEAIWSYLNDGTPTSTCRAIADAIIASDRAAGCDPDALRDALKLSASAGMQAIEHAWKAEIERDAALAAYDALAGLLEAARAERDEAFSLLKRRNDRIDELIGLCETARAKRLAAKGALAQAKDYLDEIVWVEGEDGFPLYQNGRRPDDVSEAVETALRALDGEADHG